MKIHIPAFVPMAKCNEHLAHGPIDIDLGPDVVPVVRCKDCKHYWKNVNTFGYDGVCTTVSDNDFCSHGERRGDG
jgi:hypothetical protein